MSDIAIALLGILILVLLFLLEMPVSFAMATVGFIGIWVIQGKAQAFNVIAFDLWEQFSSYGLSVIPFFILMGNIAFRCGVTDDLFRTAYTWVGRVRGGMALTTIMAATAFGAICGSTTATCATVGTIALPSMKRYGYSDALSTGSVATGGTLGPMVPPSVVLIVIGLLYNLSIAQLFMAAIPASLILSAFFILTVLGVCWAKPAMGPASTERWTWGQRLKALTGVVDTLILFVFVIGGMYSGWFTPTEGGAMGSFGAIVIGLVRRRLTWQNLRLASMDTIKTSAMVMLIVASAVILGRFLTAAYLPTSLADWVSSLAVSRFWILLVIIIVYVVGGMFTDPLGFLTVTLPVFFPLAESLGYNAIWFSILLCVLTVFGAISPPVGVNLYVVKGLRPDVPIITIMKGALMFAPAFVATIALLILFPQIVTFLVSG